MILNEAAAKAWEKLSADAIHELDVDGGTGVTDRVMIHRALNGDPSFQRRLGLQVAVSILMGEELGPAHKFWLIMTLWRMAESQTAANAISGKKSKGAPKKGAKGLDHAYEVLAAILDHGATSLENAWQIVATNSNVDVSTVKKNWMEWKPHVREVYENALVKDGAKDFEDGLKIMLRNNKGQ